MTESYYSGNSTPVYCFTPVTTLPPVAYSRPHIAFTALTRPQVPSTVLTFR